MYIVTYIFICYIDTLTLYTLLEHYFVLLPMAVANSISEQVFAMSDLDKVGTFLLYFRLFILTYLPICRYLLIIWANGVQKLV